MKRPALHIQILIALIVGACFGLVFNFGFSTGTSSKTLPDAVIRISPNHDVITYSLQEVAKENGKAPARFRQELQGVAELRKRYGDLADKYESSFDGDPRAVQIVVSNRDIEIHENLDKISVVYSRTEDGQELSTTYEGLSPQDLEKQAPAWIGAIYREIGGTPSLTVASWAKAIGDLFLRLLKMITIPLIVTSLVTGIAGLGDTHRLGNLFGKTMLYYLTTSVLAITTGIIMVNIIRPGVGAELPGADEAAAVGGADKSLTDVFGGLLENMIPANPIQSLASASFLSIITFSILLGIFIIKAGKNGDAMRNLFTSAFEVMMGMTMFVIALAPIGVCAFMVYATASQGVEIFMTLAKYMLTVFLALLFHAVVVLPLILKFVAKRSPWEFARAMSPALMTAFSTASSNGTLPLTLTSVENRAGVSNRVSSFVLPLGATINMDGTALYEAVAVLFIAQAYPGFDMTVQSQIVVAVTALLASVGAAGIPHAGLVMMAIILQAVGLPVEMQGVIIAVDRVLDMCRTSVNVWSDSCGCAVVARFDNSVETADTGS